MIISITVVKNLRYGLIVGLLSVVLVFFQNCSQGIQQVDQLSSQATSEIQQGTGGNNTQQPVTNTPSTQSGTTVVQSGTTTTDPGSATKPTQLFGVGFRKGADAAERKKMAEIIASRGFKIVRMGFNWDNDYSVFRDQLIQLKNVGVKAEVILFTSYQYISACTTDPAAAEQDAYNQTYKMADGLKDLVTDFELANETSLRPELRAEVETNTATTSSAYYNKTCYAMRAGVLKGMARAIKDVRVASGIALRSIMGTVGRDFAFLRFLQEKGVDFDVVGYHIYPLYGQKDLNTDPWFGTGGLFNQLAAFNKKVHLNEFNCAETYNAAYDDQPGSALTEDCYRSIKKHMDGIIKQKIVDIEYIMFYEFINNPSKAAPENHFGLMYDINTPKIQISLASSFAGGVLSTSEKNILIQRGLLSP